MLPNIRLALAAIDPSIAVYNLRTLTDVVEETLLVERFTLRLFLAFGALTVVLSVLGVYGLAAEGLAARRREMAIRIALGARGRELARLILDEGLALLTAGVIGGVAASLLVGRVLAATLRGVQGLDIVPFAVAVVAMSLAVMTVYAAVGRRLVAMKPWRWLTRP